jgi:ribosomal-protein-alanine N-acetyltransferase
MQLETERLWLKGWSDEDLDAFRPLATDPEVLKYINGGVPWTEAELVEYIGRQRGHLEKHGYCMWRLVEKATGRMVGFGGIQPLKDAPGTEIGWWLARDCWDKGLATEAARASLSDAFTRCGLTRLIAVAMPDNTASRHIMDKLGMTYETTGVRKGFDIVVYGISREAWLASLGVQMETQRLLLCAWREGDDAALRPFTSDPEVMRYTNQGIPWTDDQRRNWVGRQKGQFEKFGYCYWKLIDKESRRLAGFCGIQSLEWAGETQAGWWLARDFWGRGLATEAATAALSDGFTRAGLTRVVALAIPENRASRNVMAKLGFEYERDVIEDGIGLAFYGISSEKWRASGMGFAP